MAEQEADPVDLVESAPKRMFEFFAELYKVLRDQKQQQEMARQQQESQAAMQRQNQEFMTDQNERLMDSMKQAGIPDTDGNRQNAKTGLNRLERLAEDEVQTQAKLDEVDKQIKAVDDEQRSLLNPDKPGTAKIDDRLKALDTEQQRADEMHHATEEHLKKTPGITPEKLNAGLADLNKKKEEVDKAIKSEREGLEKAKKGAPKVKDIDERLQRLDQLQVEANDLHRRTENEMRTRPGIPHDERDKGLADLAGKKEEADKAIKSERAGLEMLKEENTPLTPEKINTQLEQLGNDQVKADELHKSKMQTLMDTPGMEPDKLFEGMEKLKAEKAGIDKDFAQKKEGLLKAREPKLSAGQKAEKLGELHEKKAGLLKEKGGLQQKMQGIEGEKMNVMQSKGMSYDAPKQGMGQGQKGPKPPGPKQQGPDLAGQLMVSLDTPGVGGEMGVASSLLMGGFDLMEKAIKRPNSTAATLAKEMQASGKTNLGPKQSQKVVKGVR